MPTREFYYIFLRHLCPARVACTHPVAMLMMMRSSGTAWYIRPSRLPTKIHSNSAPNCLRSVAGTSKMTTVAHPRISRGWIAHLCKLLLVLSMREHALPGSSWHSSTPSRTFRAGCGVLAQPLVFSALASTAGSDDMPQNHPLGLAGRPSVPRGCESREAQGQPMFGSAHQMVCEGRNPSVPAGRALRSPTTD